MELKILRMAMEGFKNQIQRVGYIFSGQMTLVTGDNGKGKSSIGDAVAWGLLGCNIWGNEKADSKLMNENSKATEVEIQFSLNGEIHTLIRRRQGKTTDIYLDDIKVTNEAIMRLIPDKKVFFTIFNPVYFSTLEPKDAKEFLLKVLGEVPKETVLESMEPYMRGLLLKNNFRNADIFLETQRNDLAEADKDIIYLQGIIDSNNESVSFPDRIFYDYTQMESLQHELDRIRGEKPNIPDLSQLKERRSELEKQIIILQGTKPELIDTSALEKEIILLQAKGSQVPLKEPELINIQALEERKNELLQEYNDLKKEITELKNDTIECPNCGSPVDVNEKEKARLIERLDQIRKKGVNANREIAEAKQKNDALVSEYKIIIEDYQADIRNQINDRQQQLSQAIIKNKGIEHEHIIITNTAIAKLKKEIASLNIECFEENNRKAIEEFNADVASRSAAILEKIKAENEKQMEVVKHNADRDSLEKQLCQMEAKVSQALEDIKTTEARKGDIKVLIDCAKKFNAVKLELQTKKIDQYLDKVSIRLQKLVESTGELKDDFKIMYEGKEFNVLSTAEKIKAGLELTNLIMNVTGFKYPVFIDNRESITNYIKPDTQIIEAMVVEGQELQVKSIA